MFERNLTPRSEMFSSQSKLKITLTFDSVHCFLFKNASFDQSSVNQHGRCRSTNFSYFFSFKEKKIRLQLISTGNSLLQTAHCFFPPKNASIDQSSVNQHARCSSNRFFFLQRKNPIYSSFQREIPCCRLGKSSTPPVLITHSIFFSFPPLLLRLRELDFIGCYETVDQQTAEPPKTL